MNNSASNSSKDSKQPVDPSIGKKPEQSPITPPLSSPAEPTRAYPSDASRTYSSNPSQYAYPHTPNPSESSSHYTTEPLDTARLTGDDIRIANNESKKKEDGSINKQENFEKEKQNQHWNQDFLKKESAATDQALDNKPIISYILLGIGFLCLLFFNFFIGELIIGGVAGYYFNAEMLHYLRCIGEMMNGPNQTRRIVLAALLLGIFIAATGFLIGAILVAAFKQMTTNSRHLSS